MVLSVDFIFSFYILCLFFMAYSKGAQTLQMGVCYPGQSIQSDHNGLISCFPDLCHMGIELLVSRIEDEF